MEVVHLKMFVSAFFSVDGQWNSRKRPRPPRKSNKQVPVWASALSGLPGVGYPLRELRQAGAWEEVVGRGDGDWEC
jgi:hypothetical protein